MSEWVWVASSIVSRLRIVRKSCIYSFGVGRANTTTTTIGDGDGDGNGVTRWHKPIDRAITKKEREGARKSVEWRVRGTCHSKTEVSRCKIRSIEKLLLHLNVTAMAAAATAAADCNSCNTIVIPFGSVGRSIDSTATASQDDWLKMSYTHTQHITLSRALHLFFILFDFSLSMPFCPNRNRFSFRFGLCEAIASQRN